MSQTPKANLDKVARRLAAKNDTLDRQLAAALGSAGFTVDTFLSLEKSNSPRVAAAEPALLAKLEEGGTSWEELTRPDPEDLNVNRNVRMIRV